MTNADTALQRAWVLTQGDWSDEVTAVLEELLPELVAAGYAESDAGTWRFTSEGIARAAELGLG
jgi:hypothetical protein